MELLKEIQEVNFLILKEIKRVCDNNNIKYFLDSGTLLGAVREHDIIPWDDDIDVVLLREDFEKLRALDASVWDKDFVFKDFDQFGDNLFFDTLAHVFYVGDEMSVDLPYNPLQLIEEECEDRLNNKVCLDVFVLDYVSDIQWIHNLKAIRLYFLNGLMIGHRPKIVNKRHSIIIRIIVILLASIGKCFKLSTLEERYRSCCLANKKSNTLFYSNISTIKSKWISMRTTWWTDGTMDMVFHNEVFKVPLRYHEILTQLFGDYMTPPEPAKRVPSHYMTQKR